MDVEMLIKTLMACSANIRSKLGPGYLESVYKNAMLVELQKKGLAYERPSSGLRTHAVSRPL